MRCRSRWLALCLLSGALEVAALEPAGIADGFPEAKLTIVQASGRCLFIDVYVAEDDRQRARGLMYVTGMDEFEGMYFPYPEPAFITMWMKNTYIPLDMAFVRPDGRIAGIAADTRPLSLTRIPSPEPVTGVLELNAGFAARWNVRAGDQITLSR